MMKQKLISLLMIALLSACSSKKKNHHYSVYSEYEESRGIEDGTYPADVDYYNPETGYSNSYTLDVDVESGQVVRIDFLNGGYLDDSDITPEDIDEDGICTVYDDEGREFCIHIDF